MGVVYAAYDEDLDRRVAIKLVRGASALRGPEASARLRREAQALARVSHPNVIAVHEVGEHAMPRTRRAARLHRDGVRARQDAARLVARDRTLADRDLDVLVQAGRGVVAVHEAGIVHRDIKPRTS